jgi:ABC-type enterochelin transport system ATPase subunit
LNLKYVPDRKGVKDAANGDGFTIQIVREEGNFIRDIMLCGEENVNAGKFRFSKGKSRIKLRSLVNRNVQTSNLQNVFSVN